MINMWKVMTVSCLAGLVVVGVRSWARQPDESDAPPPSQRVAREKARRPGETKFGPAHVIEPPDLIIVEVLDALPGRPISGERLVRPDGTVSLGFYGDVHVAGLTLPEIKEKIVLHMAKYLNDEILGLVKRDEESGEVLVEPATGKPKLIDPKDTDRVFVDVTAYNSRFYYVEGDVYYPSRLAYTGNESVLDVIHFVGGVLPSAERSKIRLIRSFPKGSPVKVLPIDFEEITMGTDSSTNYQILPFDRLVVPRQPDDPSRKAASPPTSQSSPSRLDSRYFPALSTTDPADKQLSSLHAVERHLNEVEKKLDRLIEVMQSAKKSTQKKATDKAATKPGSESAVEPEAESASPSKPN
jgi:polysaccharide biosynthesis/export protein